MSSSFLSKDTIFINSRLRQSGTSNDFIYNIANQVRANNRYNSIVLLDFNCYKSYYLINNQNNTFILSENGVSSTITIPIGNYNSSTLKTALTTSLNGHSYTYVVTYNSQLGKYVFTVSGNGGIQPIFNFTSNNGFGDILGFESTLNNFVADSLTSTNVANLQLTNSIQLLSSVVENNVLATIVPNVYDLSSISYSEQSPEFASQRLVTKELQSARFWLLDANNGNALDLNGLECNFTIALFESNTYFEKMLYDKKMSYIIDNLQNNGST